MDHNNFTGGLPLISANVLHLDLSYNFLSGPISHLLCSQVGSQMKTLHRLDVSHNLLAGTIPDCWENWRGLASLSINSNNFDGELPPSMGLLNELDLSTNNLSGDIPPELFDLSQLNGLNLSRNHFVGKISSNIGSMINLEALDLSNNHFSGEIPEAICNLNSLGVLNLSYNDFTGRIPSCGYFETFDSGSYVENPKLCGPPLLTNCSEEVKHDEAQQGGSNDSLNESLYIGMGVGYVAGFGGVWYSLLLNRAWRHKYFRYLDKILDCLYVFAALKLNKLRELRASSW